MPRILPSREQLEAAANAYAEGFNQGAKGKDAWLKHFSSRVEQQEPVGTEPRHGHKDLGNWFDGLWGIFGRMEFKVNELYPCGDEIAMGFTIKAYNKEGGGGVEFDGVDTFRVGHDGKIILLKGFSDPAKFRPFN